MEPTSHTSTTCSPLQGEGEGEGVTLSLLVFWNGVEEEEEETEEEEKGEVEEHGEEGETNTFPYRLAFRNGEKEEYTERIWRNMERMVRNANDREEEKVEENGE